MAYLFDAGALGAAIQEELAQTDAEAAAWLESRLRTFQENPRPAFFNLTFTLIPRFIKKTPLQPQTATRANGFVERLSVGSWTTDQLARAWWLLQLPADDPVGYQQGIDSLFAAAEVNEQVALYAALPLFAHPPRFRARAAEGVRTNLGPVFDAIALENPYPARWLEEAPWNQMVLKAFFMNKAVHRIYGLEQRSNEALAHILSDYAHERWAASRPVDPWLWKPVTPFIDEAIFPDIVRLGHSGDLLSRQTAALVCQDAAFPAARKLLEEDPGLKALLPGLRWEDLSAGKTP